MQKSMVMTVTTAMAELATYDHHMACGTVRDASVTSSATFASQYEIMAGRESPLGNSQMCTMVSDPSIDQIIETWVNRQAIP